MTDPAAYRARFASWLPDIGLLKLSIEDAAWLADGDPDQAVKALAGAGPAAVVMTRGADGIVVLTSAGDEVTVPTPPAAVVDTIGAGDTVHGALLYWLHNAGITTPDGLRDVDADGVA